MYTYFHPIAVPPYQSHDVSVMFDDSLLINSEINLVWSNVFSRSIESFAKESALTFQSNVLLHVLPVKGNDKLAKYTIPKSIDTTRSSGAFVSYEHIMNTLRAGIQVLPGIFQVVTTVTGVSTTDSFSFSRWSGVYLIASQPLSNDIRIELSYKCNVPDQLDTTGLPACPTTEFHALLFNSGFDEEVVASAEDPLYTEQYYSYLHPKSSVCFVQRQPRGPK